MRFSSISSRAGVPVEPTTTAEIVMNALPRPSETQMSAQMQLRLCPPGRQATLSAPGLYQASDLWHPEKDQAAFAIPLSPVLVVRSFPVLHLTEFTRRLITGTALH